MTDVVVDRARLDDVEAMKTILDDYASTGDLLPRSRLALYEGLRDFVVAREGRQIVGLARSRWGRRRSERVVFLSFLLGAGQGQGGKDEIKPCH